MTYRKENANELKYLQKRKRERIKELTEKKM